VVPLAPEDRPEDVRSLLVIGCDEDLRICVHGHPSPLLPEQHRASTSAPGAAKLVGLSPFRLKAEGKTCASLAEVASRKACRSMPVTQWERYQAGEKQDDGCAGPRSGGANLVITRRWTISGESGDFFENSPSSEVITP